MAINIQISDLNFTKKIKSSPQFCLKTCVVQCDTRWISNFNSCQYVLDSQKINSFYANLLGFDYHFLKYKNHEILHPAARKISVIGKFLKNYEYDCIIFIDSDAWIVNPFMLKMLLLQYFTKDIQCILSRDPILSPAYSAKLGGLKNTYINSGVYILRVGDYAKEMFRTIANNIIKSKFKHTWPYDQFHFSEFVLNNKKDFLVCDSSIMNTKSGKIIKHAWCSKNKISNMIQQDLEDQMYMQEFPLNDIEDDLPYDADNYFKNILGSK